WYAQRPRAAVAPAETTYRPDPWVRAVAAAGYQLANSLSHLPSGLLASSAFGSLVAVALIVLVREAFRCVAFTSRSASSSGERLRSPPPPTCSRPSSDSKRWRSAPSRS